MQASGCHSTAAGRPMPAPSTATIARHACCLQQSNSRASRQPIWRQPGTAASQRRLRSILVAAAAQDEEQQLDAWGEPIGPGEIGILDKDIYTTGMPDGIKDKAGYTPYEFIEFTDIHFKHEVVTRVQRPLSEVYALWENRLNWPEWFGMIEEVGFKEGDEDVCALNFWYRWAMTPWLELYVALRRTQAERDKYFVEEPEDGAPLVAAVLFQEAEGEEGTEAAGTPATLVTLRISYLLPRVLYEFAGQLAVYGDVDRKLGRSMARMKEWVEGLEDVHAALAAGEANLAEIRAGLPEHHRLQREADEEFEREKQREEEQDRQELQQRAAAAAAASRSAADDKAATASATAFAAAAAEEAAKGKKTKKQSDGSIVSNPMVKRRSRKQADS